MPSTQLLLLLATTALLQCTVADADSFQDPPARSRPRFRYWVPDASVDVDQVRADIAEAGRVGAGGVQLLGYYNYGDVQGGPGVIPTDWTKYGWGTESWKTLQDAAIQTVHEQHMTIDLTLGPNQGAGVPSEFDADGLQWDLQPFNISVPIGGSFNGTLPGWGIGKLAAATTGLVVSSKTNPVLSEKSLQDVSDQVSQTGRVDISFPANATGENNVLFAYYLVHSDYREQQTPELVISGEGVEQSPVETFRQNGSWIVDHYSAKGASAVADFWNIYLLNGDSAALLKEVGGYVWEDSQEYTANVLWTPNMTAAFEANRGYSITKYLPILLHNNRGVTYFGPSAAQSYITDELDSGDSHVADYRQTLTELNAEYLTGLTDFAHSIGVQSSAQVVYNFPMDMLANIPSVDAPECETLGLNYNLDSYRQYAGPADLAGKAIISSELGADYGSAFQQFIPTILRQIKASIVGGVNAFVLHGSAYSGSYPNTTWPTYTTFRYTFSEMHNRHQPGWDFYQDFMDYVGRVQYAMQEGVPKVDIAFWLKSTSYTSPKTSYMPWDLGLRGYSYEYLSPDDFSLPAAAVENGVLAPTTAGFKALVVRSDDLMTRSGVMKLDQWAHEGLPIMFYGGLPSNVSGSASMEDGTYIHDTLSGMQSLGNVHMVSENQLANTLGSLGLTPRTAVSANALWFPRRRESATEDLVFVWNSGDQSKGTITFESTGAPFFYDAWTGLRTPVLQYTQKDNKTMVPLELANDQTVIVGFKKDATRPVHIEKSSAPLNIHQTDSGPVLRSTSSNRAKVNLSNSTAITIPGNTSTPINLSNWTLTVESWSPPADIFNIEGTVKKNSTYQIKTLHPWSKLGLGLEHTSGRGYYTTTFSWPPTSNTSLPSLGAVLTMSPILHTAVLYVNGEKMMPLDVTAPQADISRVLKVGENKVEVVVSTPLGNAMEPVRDQLLTAGGDVPDGVSFGSKEYGLVGQVTIQPYVGVVI